LAVGGGDSIGSRVDVVITTEPTGAGGGHTYVAAAGVPLLALGAGPEGEADGIAEATLGLTRRQALRLIAAESFARQVTVMPGGGR
jgi:Flp pilus assembly protein CpaB